MTKKKNRGKRGNKFLIAIGRASSTVGTHLASLGFAGLIFAEDSVEPAVALLAIALGVFVILAGEFFKGEEK